MRILTFLFVMLSSIPSFCQEEKYSFYLVNGISQTDPISNRYWFAFNFGCNRSFILVENKINEKAFLNCGIDLGYNEGTPFYKHIVPTFPTADDLVELVGYNQHWKLGLNIGLAGYFNLKNTKLNIGSGVQPYKIFETKRPLQPEASIFSQTRYYHINWISSIGINLEKVPLLDFVSIEYSQGLTYLIHKSNNFKYKSIGIKFTKLL